MRPRHAFEQVDAQREPARLVAALDRIGDEPFYRSYKARIRALLAPRTTDRCLDVGAGTGRDALALGAAALGVDRSRVLCKEAKSRGLRVVRADAQRLPFHSASFDCVACDRTLQHVEDAAAAVGEIVRVARSGARIAIADPDYGTQSLAFPDRALADVVLAYRARRALRNGTLAHRYGELLSAAGLREVRVERRDLVVEDPRAVDGVLGLRSWARAAMADGWISEDDAARFEAGFDSIAAAGSFRYTVAFYLAAGQRP